MDILDDLTRLQNLNDFLLEKGQITLPIHTKNMQALNAAVLEGRSPTTVILQGIQGSSFASRGGLAQQVKIFRNHFYQNFLHVVLINF